MQSCLKSCSFEDKLSMCCGMHPETLESKDLIIEDGLAVKACPSLDREGLCMTYDNRPVICNNFICPEINKLNTYYSLEID